MYDAWKAGTRALLPLDEDVAREQVKEMCAKVLSNRKPPYSLKGGLYDALVATGGDMLLVTNEEAMEAQKLFEKLEGIDIEPAAGVALASLMQAVKEQRVEEDAVIMLNITGGGVARYKKEFNPVMQKPDLVFPVNPDPEMVKAKVRELIGK